MAYELYGVPRQDEVPQAREESLHRLWRMVKERHRNAVVWNASMPQPYARPYVAYFQPPREGALPSVLVYRSLAAWEMDEPALAEIVMIDPETT